MIDIRNYRAEGVLKDGTPVTIRAIRADDWQEVLAAFKSLDEASIYTRFFTYKKALSDAELKEITDVDFDRVVALIVVAERGDRETLVGGGRYAAGDEPGRDRSAELAFVTGAEFRRQGVASLVLKHLMDIARSAGLSKLEAIVLPQNHAMLSVFRHCGRPAKEWAEDGTIHVVIELGDAGAHSGG